MALNLLRGTRPAVHWRCSSIAQGLTKRFRVNPRPCFSLLRHASSSAPSHFKPVGSTFKLPSGRILGYHTSGDPNGVPVFYIHGNPDSGIVVTGEMEKKVAKKIGIRWIGPDRPGVGLSTMYQEQEISHYPQDIQSLVDHLALPKYYIIGTSGGTGYALACAKDLSPTQLKGVGICAGVGPVECGFDSMGEIIKKAWDLWRDYPAEMEAYIDAEYTHLAQDPDPSALRARIESDLRSYLAGDDLEHVLDEETLSSTVDVYRQVYAQGARAHAKGIEVNLKPWGFSMEDITFKGINLWYGEGDVNTTPAMGRYMAGRLRESKYREYRGKSHLTIWDEETLEEMLKDLLDAKE